METSEWVSGLTPNDHFLRRHFTNDMHEPCPRCDLHVHLWNSTLTSRGYFAWQMSPQERNSIATARVNAVKAFARDVHSDASRKRHGRSAGSRRQARRPKRHAEAGAQAAERC